jgi:nucleoside-diphosphate-sugar epimerase
VKLLLDEMHAPAVAERLRAMGHDVVAVKERPELIGRADADLLAAAAAEGRAIVTENVKDFAVLHRLWAAAGQVHAGMVFTHPRRFPRGAGDHIRRLGDALARFLDDVAASLRRAEPFTWWLDE